jgi:tRNA pseudouridine38-40 synthase
MARYKLTIEYVGTRYSGWQIQTNARTVQGEIDKGLRHIVRGGHVATYGAGRTDAGVHALAQVAHADLGMELPPATLTTRLNDALPHDINVLSAERVAPRFHARHSAVARSYVYQIARRRTAFAKPFVWWVRDDLHLDAMRAGADAFLGLTDFSAFTADDPEEKSTSVLVNELRIAAHDDLVLLRVVGSHFLWKMVRRLTGVLVEVGRGSLSAGDVPSLLSGDRAGPARLTAPSAGLFLERVFYDTPPPDRALTPPLLLLSRPG